MRLYEFIVPPGAENRRVKTLIRDALPLLPESALRDAFARRDVKMDGARIGADASAAPGAKIRVYTPFVCALPVVFEDESLLLLDKPAGLSCVDDGRGGMTVESLYPDYALCHRLDNQTSGLLLLARTDEAREILYTAFRDRTIEKQYECLTRGLPRTGDYRAFLNKDAESAHVTVSLRQSAGALPIETVVEPMSQSGEIGRARVTLVTGRTHQIRAHLAFLGFPILGDDKYGDRAFNRRQNARRLMLHAASLTPYLPPPLDYLNGRTFTSPAPF